MSRNPYVLGIIPARGGSKGIKRKNLVLLNGQPLIAHTILAASKSKMLSRVIVSTEDDEIARVANSYHADVPFRRPKSLATDKATTFDVVQHSLRWIELHDRPVDYLVILQPTTPLRLAIDIDSCVRRLLSTGADSVVSVSPPLLDNPYYAYKLKKDRPIQLIGGYGLSRRQDYPPVFIRNGAVYCYRRDVFGKKKSFPGRDIRAYLMPARRSINIDTLFDLKVAEMLLQKNL